MKNCTSSFEAANFFHSKNLNKRKGENKNKEMQNKKYPKGPRSRGLRENYRRPDGYPQDEVPYPLSSCDCAFPTPAPVLNAGLPTNMSVGNCLLSQRGLRNNPVFKEQVEPKNTGECSNISLGPYGCYYFSEKNGAYNRFAQSNGRGYEYLNRPSAQDYNPDFYQVDCPQGSTVYFAQDARLFDSRRNSLIKLNRPPYSSNFFTTNNDMIPEDYYSIYQPSFDQFGAKVYSGYGDIRTGDITYWIDRETEDAYHQPNFTIPSQVEGVLFKDPMGGIKPTYVRKVVQKPDDSYNKLSWIRDSAMHREDIMASQMSQINQERWTPRWTNIKANA